MRLCVIVSSSALALVLGSLSASGAPGQDDEMPEASSVVTTPWPGGSSARTVDVRADFGPDMSGLSYVAGDTRADDRLWAVRNDGRLFRLAESGGRWRADPAEGWGQGRKLAFPDGRRPDAEAVVMQGRSAYVGTERDGTGASRPSVVRYDTTDAGATLTATHEWNLQEYYPNINPNLGIEALSLVPNDVLVAGGFVTDDGRRFDPADHPGQYGAGVFMVAVEAPGLRDHVDAYVFSEDGTATRVARLPHPLRVVTELEFEPDTGSLWAHCDDFCGGEAVVLRIAEDGRWGVVARHARPTGLPDQNFEGLTIAPHTRCVDGRKPVFYSNDSNNAGHALWRGSLDCAAAPRISVTAPNVPAGRKARVRVEARLADGRPASGRVTVRVAGRQRVARLAEGAVTVRVGSFARTGGRHVTAEHPVAGTARTTLRVRKARTRLTPVTSRLAARPGARVRVAAKVEANGLRLGGKVRVKMGGRWTDHTVLRRKGRLVVRITAPRRSGVVAMRLRYAGGAHTTPATATYRLRVR